MGNEKIHVIEINELYETINRYFLFYLVGSIPTYFLLLIGDFQMSISGSLLNDILVGATVVAVWICIIYILILNLIYTYRVYKKIKEYWKDLLYTESISFKSSKDNYCVLPIRLSFILIIIVIPLYIIHAFLWLFIGNLNSLIDKLIAKDIPSLGNAISDLPIQTDSILFLLGDGTISYYLFIVTLAIISSLGFILLEKFRREQIQLDYEATRERVWEHKYLVLPSLKQFICLIVGYIISILTFSYTVRFIASMF